MNSDFEFESFFYISKEKLLLSVFKKDLDKEIYKETKYGLFVTAYLAISD